MLIFTALDFTFTTRPIHNRMLFLLWPSHFFLELLVIVLRSSPVSYWTPTDLGAYLPGSFLFVFLYFLPFYSWGSCGKTTEVVCHSFFQWTTFCQNSPLMITLSWVDLPGMAYSFVELCKPLRHNKAVIYEVGVGGVGGGVCVCVKVSTMLKSCVRNN